MSRMPFPFYLSVGTTRLHPHTVFESLAYVVGFQSYLWLKKRHEDVISPESRWQQIAASVMGAALGSRILGMLQSPNEAWIASFARGKTIVGAILGAWIAVGWVKKKTGIVVRTGDLYAVPLTLGVIVGRIGCFLTGLSDETYGTATPLPWAIDFGDGDGNRPRGCTLAEHHMRDRA